MKLNPRFRSRSRCWPKSEQGSKPWTKYVEVNSDYVQTKTEEFVNQCWIGYEKNVRKYANIAEKEKNCMYYFFCWILQPAFNNSTFIAHNRFF